jgi:hypothetical protein
MTTRNYILNEQGQPVAEPNLWKWGVWFEHSRGVRVVGRTKIGRVTVSTVFLGLDHGWNPKGPPILWETMVFHCDRNELDTERCSGSREQAETMHERMVAKWKLLSRAKRKVKA